MLSSICLHSLKKFKATIGGMLKLTSFFKQVARTNGNVLSTAFAHTYTNIFKGGTGELLTGDIGERRTKYKPALGLTMAFGIALWELYQTFLQDEDETKMIIPLLNSINPAGEIVTRSKLLIGGALFALGFDLPSSEVKQIITDNIRTATSLGYTLKC